VGEPSFKIKVLFIKYQALQFKSAYQQFRFPIRNRPLLAFYGKNKDIVSIERLLDN
jgi:hypothetical protein